MYSSSVLIVYEGDPEAMEHALEEEKKIADLRDQNGEEEDDQDDDEEEELEFEINEESLELVDVQLGDGLPQTAININIDPSTAQFPTLGDDDEDEEDAPKVHDLRLIDFAHATWTPGAGPDENVLMGIRSLIKMFQELAA